MAVESATYIADLDATKPAGTENASDVDDYLRLIKAVWKASFPNVSAAVTASAAELNLVSGLTASAAELNILDNVTITVTELNRLSGVTSNVQTQLNGKMTAYLTQSVKADNFTASAANHYILRTNSSKTATMPASATSGDMIWITNTSGGNWTVARNGLKIMGAASDDTIATGNHHEYLYVDATTGWARTKAS